MKRIISTFLLLLLMLSSCGILSPGPDKTVESFFTAANSMDIEAMTALINPTKQELIEDTKSFFAELEGEDFPSSMKKYFSDAAKEISYEILETEIDKDKAEITIESRYVDSKTLLADIISELFSRILKMALSGIEEDEDTLIDQVTADIIPEVLVADKVEIFTVDLVKYNGKWYFDELNDELMNVLSAGFYSLASDFDTLTNDEEFKEELDE